MVKITQGAFNAGVISQGMYSRNDTEKYQKGLRQAVNMVVLPQGGVQNRSGFEAVTRIDTSGASENQWLVRFEFNTAQTYQLEFTDDVFRVIKDGAYVLDSDVGELLLSAVSTAAAATLTLDDAGDAASLSVGDLVYIRDPDGDHKLHETTFKITGIASAVLSIVAYDNAVLDTSSGDWGTLDATATVQKVYAKTHTLGDFVKLRFAQDADTIYFAHPAHPPAKIGRVADDDWTFEDVAFGAKVTPVTDASVGVTAVKGADVDNSRLNSYAYAVSAIEGTLFEESVATATVAVDNDLYYQDSINTITWDAVVGATRYAVYRVSAGALAYIGTTEELTFADENITPDKARGPQLARNPFGSAGEYPSIVAFYEQRLAYGAPLNDPQLVEMSRIGNIENFNGAFPALPDDAFRFRLRDSRVNTVRAFVPTKSFVMLTSGGEWELSGQGDGEYVRPDKRGFWPFTNYGSAALEPLYTGTVILFVEPSGNVVREYRPNDRGTPPQDLTIIGADLLENKKIVSWAYAAAPNKTVWAVMDDGSLLTLTYMPEHDVWGWTEHAIGGTAAKVKQVSVTREGARDVPYFVIARTLNGSTVTMVERQRAREDVDVLKCYFLDGGAKVTYASTVGEISGLLHLRGEPVHALLDGDVFKELAVDATGTVSFEGLTITDVSIGLAYTCLIQTLDVRMDSQTLGSSEGRLKATSEVAVRLKRSRGVEAGVSLERMQEMKEWQTDLVDGPLPLLTHTPNVTVEGDWLTDATVYVQQGNPLPMTVLGITPEWELGE
ncbi:portal protein [Octadecabacter Antarctic BD virus 1]|nr:portal protein [Octadecabacter Antarctic BD virus 1]